MSTRARKSQRGPASLAVKIDVDVLVETERIARAAGVTRNAYIAHALRHYNRLHAITRSGVRALRGRVVRLFPKPVVATSAPSQVRQKPRGR